MEKEKQMTDKEFREWEDRVFGYGYGTGEMRIVKGLKKFMELLKENRSYDFQVLEEKIGDLSTWLLINTLCRANILEYGTSPRFGWLTDEGERLWDYMQEKTADDLYDILCNQKDDE